MARRMSRRLGLLLVVAALPLALWGVLPMLSGAESPSSIQNKIDAKRHQIEQRRGRERVLTTDISAATHKINALQGDITQLQSKQVRLQGVVHVDAHPAGDGGARGGARRRGARPPR